MRIKRLKLPFISLFFLFISTQVNAMGLFDFLKINVLSDVNGVVTLNGQPVSGVKVVLNVRIVFNNEKIEVVTETDINGKFHFDAINSKSINTILPSAKMIDQRITFHYQGKEYLGWDMVKNNYDYNGELNDLSEPENRNNLIPFNLSCELNDKSTTRRSGTHEHIALTGICRWEGESTK